MKKEPKLVLNYSEIDMEICALRGEGSADFLILCADGVPFKSYGTPLDSPHKRELYDYFCRGLNRKNGKDWLEFFTNWKRQFIKDFQLPPDSTAESFKPKFSWLISRVCHGYSEHLHAAVSLIDKLLAEEKLIHWDLTRATTYNSVRLVMPSGNAVLQSGDTMSLAIAQAALRVLKTSN